MTAPRPGPPQGDRTWKFCGGSPTSPSPGRGARGRRLLSSPLQGGGREGGPAAGSAGVPPASREARTRMRAFGPPCRRDAGAPRRFTDERDREAHRPGCTRSTPLPTSPLKGGRREDGSARLPVRPSRALPNGGPHSSPLEGGLGGMTAPARPPAGRSHLEILRRLAGIAIAGQGGARPPFSLLPPSGGRSGGGSRPWERRRPAGLARSANEDAGLRPAKPAGRRRTQAIHG